MWDGPLETGRKKLNDVKKLSTFYSHISCINLKQKEIDKLKYMKIKDFKAFIPTLATRWRHSNTHLWFLLAN